MHIQVGLCLTCPWANPLVSHGWLKYLAHFDNCSLIKLTTIIECHGNQVLEKLTLPSIIPTLGGSTYKCMWGLD